MRFGTRMLFAPDGGGGSGGGSGADASAGQQGQQSQQPPASQGNGAQQGASQGNGSAGQQSQQGESEQRGGKPVVLPQSAMKRIKQEAEERGQKRAREAMAKEFGFSTFAAMQEHFAHKPARAQEQDDQPEREERRGNDRNEQRANGEQRNGQQNSRAERREQGRWEREKERLQREKDALARRMTQEARQRKALQAALDAKDAEMSLREVAVKTGIRDVDYAVRLLTRHLEGMSEEEISKLDGGKGFDEGKFFEGLRGTHPYLFGEVTKPATTGTGAGNAPPPPKPGAAAQAQQQGNQVDAKKMSREEFQEHLRKRGLSVGL